MAQFKQKKIYTKDEQIAFRNKMLREKNVQLKKQQQRIDFLQNIVNKINRELEIKNISLAIDKIQRLKGKKNDKKLQ